MKLGESERADREAAILTMAAPYMAKLTVDDVAALCALADDDDLTLAEMAMNPALWPAVPFWYGLRICYRSVQFYLAKYTDRLHNQFMENTKTVRLEGTAAIEFAAANDLPLCKYTDPTEEAREDLTVEEANAVAREDAHLIYIDTEVAA